MGEEGGGYDQESTIGLQFAWRKAVALVHQPNLECRKGESDGEP